MFFLVIKLYKCSQFFFNCAYVLPVFIFNFHQGILHSCYSCVMRGVEEEVCYLYIIFLGLETKNSNFIKYCCQMNDGNLKRKYQY